MTTRTLLSYLTDEELVRLAHAEHDSLTVTALEIELLNRFEATRDRHKEQIETLVFGLQELIDSTTEE